MGGEQSTDQTEPDTNMDDQNEVLNSPITEQEIRSNVKKLRNNKSPSDDNITNEFLKSTINIMVPLYVEYFNIILDTGILPDTWLKGIICPIYKHSGDPSSPENYRPITLVSCFSKLFTSILNNRFNAYLEENARESGRL